MRDLIIKNVQIAIRTRKTHANISNYSFNNLQYVWICTYIVHKSVIYLDIDTYKYKSDQAIEKFDNENISVNTHTQTNEQIYYED